MKKKFQSEICFFKKCDGDEACMIKVKKIWGKCSGACKCQTGCNKKAAAAKKECKNMSWTLWFFPNVQCDLC